jgi:hypothetical protein
MAQSTVLVVIDMLNRYEHDDADALRSSVQRVLPAMRALIGRAREHDAPIVYVNDNYGDWSAGHSELCEQALQGPHRALVEPILPPTGAAFLTKARHSIFYETSLEYLLRSQGIERASSLPARSPSSACSTPPWTPMSVTSRSRLPRDAVAHIHPDLASAALRMMEMNMRAQITDADALFASERPVLPQDPLGRRT